MTIRPADTLNKALLSTTSHFVGEFETNDLLFTHAWPNVSDSAHTVRWSEGPASRSAFVFVFETPPFSRTVGSALPDHSWMPELFSWYLSVLFGKRFDNHGLIETIGHFNLPNLEQYSSLCRHTLPHNSHKVRVDLSIPLNLAEISRIRPLLDDTVESAAFLRIFQGAAKFYSQALQAFERDAEVAYLHLVTAGEILSNSSDIPSGDLYDAQTKNHLLEIESQLSEGRKIARHFRGKMLSIKRRFVKTIVDLVDDDFFAVSEAEEPYSQLKAQSFIKIVAAAYDLRSHYVHTGAPFGRWIERSFAGVNSEIQVGRPVVSDKDYGKTLANAPTFVGLERIIRYCLIRAAERYGAYVAPAAPEDP